MNRRWALALPATREAKSASERERVTTLISFFFFFFPFNSYDRHTISLLASRGSTLANLADLLQVEVPALLLAAGVLDVEADDGLGLLDGILALGGIGLEGSVDRVERGGRGESI